MIIFFWNINVYNTANKKPSGRNRLIIDLTTKILEDRKRWLAAVVEKIDKNVYNIVRIGFSLQKWIFRRFFSLADGTIPSYPDFYDARCVGTENNTPYMSVTKIRKWFIFWKYDLPILFTPVHTPLSECIYVV